MNTQQLRSSLIGLSVLALLAACGDDQSAEKTKKEGVFTPYVEAHDEAKATADAVNEALKLQQQRLQERD